MMKRICLLALLAFALCLEDVEAKDSFMVTGAGYNSCGAWTKAQGHRPPITTGFYATFADLDLVQQISWVQGFLTAFNYYASNSGNVLNDVDNNGVFAWIDNYCAAHPLDSIGTATFALIAELSKRSGQ